MTAPASAGPLARRLELVGLLRALGGRFTVVGSVARQAPHARDLDLAVERADLTATLRALSLVGAWWGPLGPAPSARAVIDARHAGCATSFGPVDLFVEDPP